MADLDSKPVSSVRNFKPVRPTFPPAEQVECNQDGLRRFSVQTPRGAIAIEEMYYRAWGLRGQPEALEAFGAIKSEWLPGLPGNGRSRQTVVFAPDGRIFLGSWKGGRPPLPHITIAKNYGRTFTVFMPFNSAELAESEEFRRQCEQRQTWEKAKSVHLESDFPGQWQKSVLKRIGELEGLIDGRLHFSGSPEIGLRVRDQKPILLALTDAKAWVECCTPQLKDAIRKDNVYSLNGEAYRRLAG